MERMVRTFTDCSGVLVKKLDAAAAADTVVDMETEFCRHVHNVTH